MNVVRVDSSLALYRKNSALRSVREMVMPRTGLVRASSPVPLAKRSTMVVWPLLPLVKRLVDKEIASLCGLMKNLIKTVKIYLSGGY